MTRLATAFRLAPVLLCGALAMPLAAQDRAADPLFDALGMPELVEVMREEGLSYGESIAAEMFSAREAEAWQAFVSEIYDAERMTQDLRIGFDTALTGADIDAMLAFFTSEPGRSIVALEVSARRAMLDDAIEEASKDTAARAREEGTPRFDQIDAFVMANDLIETNVAGAMNASLAFYRGMLDGGAYGGEVTLSDLVADLWASEAETRQSTTEWVYAFLMLAYQPLSDADLDAYTAFSETPAGRDLNRALFAAFDATFDDISHALGLAAAQLMAGQDL